MGHMIDIREFENITFFCPAVGTEVIASVNVLMPHPADTSADPRPVVENYCNHSDSCDVKADKPDWKKCHFKGRAAELYIKILGQINL